MMQGKVFICKNAFREIRYSIDSEACDRRLRFRIDWSTRGLPGIGEDDEVYIEVPAGSEYLSFQLVFLDGTKSDVLRVEA
jgi:hypothetical protein